MFSARGTIRANFHRPLGDICTQLLHHSFTQERIRLKQNVPKAGTKFRDGSILIGFSSIFKVFILILFRNQPIRFGGTNCSKASQINGRIKILLNADSRFSGEVFELKLGLQNIIDNIVDATPFGRDILKELADECHKQGIKLHFYYSHIDWTRPDYPSGRTGLNTGRDVSLRNWPSYYKFMNNQLTELLTNYGEIGAIWFDGMWDHDEDSIPFDWQLTEQYELIHKLQPACLIGNNHHLKPFPGEDIQIFERDLPGENTAGLSGQEVSQLPLETCQTMNGMWGYKVADQDYKSVPQLIHLLVKAAGMGANLLLNIGPQPDGELPAASLERLKGIGEWMNKYGETFYATTAGDFEAQPWGTSTRKGNKLYLHILSADTTDIEVPIDCKVKKAVTFDDRKKVNYTKKKEGGITLHLDKVPADCIDYIVELETSTKK